MIPRVPALLPLFVLALASTLLSAQKPVNTRVVSRDSMTVVAGARYSTSDLKRFLLGNTYRDLWTTPIKVPILDMRTFAGGVKPTKLGGGLSTKTLRMANPQGLEFVFRLVDKSKVATPPMFEGSVVDDVFRDQVSALHPAGAVIAARLLDAAGVFHPTAVLVYMPDDSLLGEFRADFANQLGMVEEYPNVPADAPGFAGALEIIDSEELLEKLNTNPMHRVDARAMLAARLIDLLISDNDRHSGQWKWARMRDAEPVVWTPIPRDRDHAFIRLDGSLIHLARFSAPHLVLFEGSSMNVEGLTEHRGFDGRMLASLEKSVWDSVALAITRRMSDSVIDAAVLAQPREYHSSAVELAEILKSRRNQLREASEEFYSALASVTDVHATDAADRAIVKREDDRHVSVRLETTDGRVYFQRRFDTRETHELRVFLHGGDDEAVVTGNVRRSIRVRIAGGNGDNRIVDSSSVNGDEEHTRIYGQGEIDGIDYGEDTLFNRKPWVQKRGKLEPPGPDRGGRIQPIFGITSQSRLGLTPMIGAVRRSYGFERYPYSSLVKLEAEYAMKYRGWRVSLNADKRIHQSRFHVVGQARMSDIEVARFRGYEDFIDLDEEEPETFRREVRQRQWIARPALALSLNAESDISIGPTFQYSQTDSIPDALINETSPYGYGLFRQAGLRGVLHLEIPAGLRPPIENENGYMVKRRPLHNFVLDFDATHYTAFMDVTSPYQSLTLRAGGYSTLPLPTDPILLLRAGARRLVGTFPFHDSAYVGGRGTARPLRAEHQAGDASVWGSAEVRMKVAEFMLGLPLQSGVMALGDAGRVYLDGKSPGGWNTAYGGGLWVGLKESLAVATFTLVNHGGRMRFLWRSGLTF